MKITSADINEFGQLTKLGLHDASIVGFSYRYDEEFSFDMRRVDGSAVSLSLTKVTRFGCSGFQKGAIVSDVYIWRPGLTPAWHASDAEGAWAVLFGNEIDVATLPSVIKPIVEGREASFLVLVECSYGGSIALLCEEIEAREAASGVPS